MDENNFLSDGTPIAKFEDAVEFIKTRADRPCSSCGHFNWSVFTSVKKGDIQLGLGPVGLELHTGQILTSGAPVLITTCKKCAYMKMHNLTEISRWAANGKPEFEDGQ